MELRIGTRGSKLALWQAEKVKSELAALGVKAELEIIKTQGDLNQTQALNAIGDKGLFTRALDDALIRGDVDLAVHSSKDIPTIFDESLFLAATLQREDPRDVLLAVDETVDLDNFNRKMVIGTSSLRRQAFLAHFAPHVEVKVIRGNVDTRLKKMMDGDYDGIVLAYAGVKRMGLTQYIVRKLNATAFTPAIGQGAVGIVCRREDSRVLPIIQQLNHLSTYQAVTSERAYLKKMEGGCHVPIFGLATVLGDLLSLEAGVASLDGKTVMRDKIEGPASEAEALGTTLAERILNNGGGKLIHE